MFQHVLENEYSPQSTSGDWNCLYRAIFLALAGSEDCHLLLRLSTGLELILNNSHYDTKKKSNDFLNDIRIVTSPYENLVDDAVQAGEYQEMAHIYALNAAVGRPFFQYS
jgi:hypothetical protein